MVDVCTGFGRIGKIQFLMTWDDINLGTYLKIHPIIMNDWAEYDKFKEIVYILTGKHENVHQWSEKQVREYSFLFDTKFDKKVPEVYKAGGKFYRINDQIKNITAGRYIEVKSFYANDYMTNLDKIIASLSIPVKRWGFKYKNLKYDALQHDKYAADMLSLPFKIAYVIGLQCLNIINKIDGNYPILFGQSVENEGESDLGIEQTFMKYYGWIYSTAQIAEHERITLDQAFELPVVQYLNDLAYLKMKDKLEKAQMDRLHKKH